MKKLSWPHRCWREWSKIINAFSVVISLVVVMIIARPVCAAGRQEVPVHLPAVAARLQPLGAWTVSQPLNLAIGLPLRNQEALTNLLRANLRPGQPELPPLPDAGAVHGAIWPDRTGLSGGRWPLPRRNGLTVTATHPNRMLLDVSGSVADIEQALHVTLRTYRHPTEHRTFYAPDTEPSLDLAVPVLDISGLDNYSLPRPRLRATPLVNAAKRVAQCRFRPSGTYMGNDFRAAYVPDTSLNGSGQVVGLLQFDGYTASDITYYESQAGLPNVTLSNVLMDGASGRAQRQRRRSRGVAGHRDGDFHGAGVSKVIVYDGAQSQSVGRHPQPHGHRQSGQATQLFVVCAQRRRPTRRPTRSSSRWPPRASRSSTPRATTTPLPG